MGYLNPNNVFIFSGSNLNFVKSVRFGELRVWDLHYMSDTGISGTVPPAAYTNDVSFVTSLYPDGAFIDSPFIILRQSDQVSVGPLPTISGNAGDIITVTGANFYQITDVNFGETPASFSMVDSGTLEVEVPSNPDYSSITVYSSLRTGIDDDKTIASGLSPDEFIPIPNISGISDLQPASGTTLSITGDSLSGVSGLNFTFLSEDAPVEASGSNFINFEVPSGNIRGVPSFMLYSGGISTFPAPFSFSPLASVTGVGPAVQTGAHFYISGDNFSTGILYKTGDNYLATVMGQTGEFALLSDKVMSGQVPTGITILTSGGNVSVGPTISSGVVSLFSDNYPETHPSEVYFTPAIGPPRITSITPTSGIVGDTLSIEGNDLYGITGVNLLGSASSTVGIGTYDAGTIAEVTPGFELAFEVGGTVSSLGALGEYYDVVLSGFYGAVTGASGFFSLGTPSITSNTPSTNVVPGATGLIEGARLYSGTSVELYTGETSVVSFKPYRILPSSGYTDNHDQIKYSYPNSFPTGLNYRMVVRNRRSFDGIANYANLGVFKVPYLSGFEPSSGEYGSTITVSGYFENLHTSGLTIGDVTALEFTQPATTGFNFVIPSNAQTDTLTIGTSGGVVSSTGFLSVMPSKPTISGYYSGTLAPDSIDYNQVFVAGNRITISGDGMNLVTGVKFSGESGSFDFNSFTSQTYSNLGFNVPGGINGVSGKFRLMDSLGRTTDSDSTGINLISVSGFSNFLLPADTLNMTGYNINGMRVLFPYATGGFTEVIPHSNTLLADGAETLHAQVPTGIVYGDLRLTGRVSQLDLGGFYPVGVITGTEGIFSSGSVDITGVDKTVSLTGINVFDTDIDVFGTSGSGVFLLGFSGSRNEDYPEALYPDTAMTSIGGVSTQTLPIDNYSTGVGTIGGVDNVFYSKIDFKFEYDKLLSGNIFIIDPWWGISQYGAFDLYNPNASNSPTYSYSDFIMPDSGFNPFAYDIVNRKINYFSQDIVSSGETFYVTGFGPIRGTREDKVRLSGSNLDKVEDVVFSPSLPPSQGTNIGRGGEWTATFSGVSSQVLEVTVPPSLQGEGGGPFNIVLNGLSGLATLAYHTGFSPTGVRLGDDGNLADILHEYQYIPLTEGLDYGVISGGFPEPLARVDTTINYTTEETVNEAVFLVTRTKFPDGTTMIINSVPKP